MISDSPDWSRHTRPALRPRRSRMTVRHRPQSPPSPAPAAPQSPWPTGSKTFVAGLTTLNRLKSSSLQCLRQPQTIELLVPGDNP